MSTTHHPTTRHRLRSGLAAFCGASLIPAPRSRHSTQFQPLISFHCYSPPLSSARAGAFNETQPPKPDLTDVLARPADSFTFEEVGAKFGYSGDEFDLILNGDSSNL